MHIGGRHFKQQQQQQTIYRFIHRSMNIYDDNISPEISVSSDTEQNANIAQP